MVVGTSTVESPVTPQVGVAPSTAEQRVCYRVSLEKGEDGWIVAKCLDAEGAISQGKTVDEALKNIIEAISGILEARGQVHEFLITWVEK
jgi:predicted RNase H-like HicB family nuclease